MYYCTSHYAIRDPLKYTLALTQHILGGDIAHFQVRAAADRTFRYVL